MSTIIGIHHGGHDSSVALVIDGKLVCAIEEEKLTGIKAIHSYWAHPVKGLEFIEKNFGVTLENCDHVAFALPKHYKIEDDNICLIDKTTSYSHHKCHALGAYFTSGFEGKVLAVSHDGQGNRSRGKVIVQIIFHVIARNSSLVCMQKKQIIITGKQKQRHNSPPHT